MSMLEKEFPERAKELNDEMKERRNQKSDAAKSFTLEKTFYSHPNRLRLTASDSLPNRLRK